MSKCDYCGANIIWAQIVVGSEAKNVALDASEPVYHHDGEKWIQSRANVNHYAVCPHRRKWRKSQLEKKQEFEKELQQKKETGRAWWLDLDK